MENNRRDIHVADAAESAAAQSRLALYSVYPLLFFAGAALLFSGNVATMVGGLILVFGSFFGSLKRWRLRQLDMEMSCTVRCPSCGRRVALDTPVCPRCESRL